MFSAQLAASVKPPKAGGLHPSLAGGRCRGPQSCEFNSASAPALQGLPAGQATLQSSPPDRPPGLASSSPRCPTARSLSPPHHPCQTFPPALPGPQSQSLSASHLRSSRQPGQSHCPRSRLRSAARSARGPSAPDGTHSPAPPPLGAFHTPTSHHPEHIRPSPHPHTGAAAPVGRPDQPVTLLPTRPALPRSLCPGHL